jgi:hypothetical protein
MKKLLNICSTPPWWGICVLFASFLSDTPHEIISSSIVIHLLFILGIYPKEKANKRAFILILLSASTYMVFHFFQTILDLEAGISLLTFLVSAKVFELNNKRDKAIYYYIGFLVITGITVFNQSFYASIISISLISLGVWGHTSLDQHNKFSFQLGGVSTKNLFAYGFVASAILIICYLLFPRINFGFRNQSTLLGKSNFSPTAAPGEVDQLILTDDPVFVAKLNKKQLSSEKLYWVGTILTRTDGYFWNEDRRIERLPAPKALSKASRFEIQLRGQNNEYLFTPDTAIGPPNVLESFFILNEKSFKLKRATHKKITYSGDFTFKGKFEKPDFKYYKKRKSYRKAKDKTFQLASKLKASTREETLQNILNYFVNQKFIYTLKSGETSSVDDFLFITKKGFCTHFASATALLLRLNDIPSRVISGFHGGEYNSFGDFYTITGKDAHAWVEYYLEEEGWQRVDPVDVISPERVRLGGQAFFNIARDAQGRAIRDESWFSEQYQVASMFLASLNNDWQRFFYEYDQVSQLELAKSMGMHIGKLYYYGSFLIMFLIFVLIITRIKKEKKRIHDPVIIEYQKFLSKVEKLNIYKPTFETPHQFFIKLKKELGLEYKDDLDKLNNLFNQYHYSTDQSHHNEIILLLKRITQLLKDKKVK